MSGVKRLLNMSQLKLRGYLFTVKTTNIFIVYGLQEVLKVRALPKIY